MSKKAIILIVVLFLLIVAGMFIFADLKQQEAIYDPVAEEPQQPEEPTEPDPYAHITRIDAKHYFIDGTHTLVGEINMPTPCELLETEATVMESDPEQVRIDFTIINNADTCAQVITAQRFMVEAEASEDATFSAFLNDRAVELNLIPAAPGETPEDFELFIKG